MVRVGPPLLARPAAASRGSTPIEVARAGDRVGSGAAWIKRVGGVEGAGVVDRAVAGEERADGVDRAAGLEGAADGAAARLGVERDGAVEEADGAAADIQAAGGAVAGLAGLAVGPLPLP